MFAAARLPASAAALSVDVRTIHPTGCSPLRRVPAQPAEPPLKMLLRTLPVLRPALLAAVLTGAALFATPPALDPSDARGVFWKQQKLEKGSEENVSEAPGTWDYDRGALFTKLKNEGVNVVVIDIDTDIRTTANAAKRAEIGDFIADLYNWDTTMPIKVWLHQRRYFNGGTDLAKTPDQNDAEFDEAAQDLKSIFQEVSTAESHVIDGIRWGENGDDNMAQHLKRAILYARKINATSYKGATDWLTNHSFIINGYQLGCEFSGLLNAQDSVGFSAKILPEVGAFAFAYKHYSNRATGGVGATFTAWCNSFSPAKTDTVANWKQFYKAEFGLDELQQWIHDRSSGKARNYIYVGDSADSVSTTPANSLDALKELSADGVTNLSIAKISPVFMLPFAAEAEKSNPMTYYNEEKVLFWLSGPLATPTFTTSTSAGEWYNGW